jgi:hypothetical protein
MGVFMSRFPALNEIQDLYQNYRKSPEYQKELESLVTLCLDFNAESMRKAAKAGQNFYDFDEPGNVQNRLVEMLYSTPDFYRLIEKRLRMMGYSTILSVHNDCSDEMFCELLISW